MSDIMIDVLEARAWAVKNASMFQKAEAADSFADAMMAYLRDVENRLQALERKP